MEKDVYETSSLGIDETPILPEGWNEGDDLFADAATDGDTVAADGSESVDLGSTENEGGADGDLEVPTTDVKDAEAGPNAEDVTEELGADGSEEPAAPPSRILKLKVNHNEYELDVNSLSDEDLIARLQKADAFDAMKDAQMKDKFREVYEEQILNGMTEGVAKLVASNACGGKTYSLNDEEEPAVSTAPAAAPVAAEPQATADFTSQVKQLKTIFPDFKSMPEEVMAAYSHGADLISAYSAYRVRESEKASKTIKKENQILRQNAASAAKAPVKGVTGGGNTGQKADDPFLRGFDSDNW